MEIDICFAVFYFINLDFILYLYVLLLSLFVL